MPPGAVATATLHTPPPAGAGPDAQAQAAEPDTAGGPAARGRHTHTRPSSAGSLPASPSCTRPPRGPSSETHLPRRRRRRRCRRRRRRRRRRRPNGFTTGPRARYLRRSMQPARVTIVRVTLVRVTRPSHSRPSRGESSTHARTHARTHAYLLARILSGGWQCLPAGQAGSAAAERSAPSRAGGGPRDGPARHGTPNDSE